MSNVTNKQPDTLSLYLCTTSIFHTEILVASKEERALRLVGSRLHFDTHWHKVAEFPEGEFLDEGVYRVEQVHSLPGRRRRRKRKASAASSSGDTVLPTHNDATSSDATS